MFKESDFIKIIKTTTSDYETARKWERIHKQLSLYDYLHIAIAKRLNATLITRDKKLMKFSKNIVPTCKPEDLIR